MPEKVWEALVQSQIRFNRVPEKVPEKGLWQSQVRFNRICGHLTHGNPAEVFPALGFAARFRKFRKNKTLRLLWIPPKFIWRPLAPICNQSTLKGCPARRALSWMLECADMWQRNLTFGTGCVAKVWVFLQ